MKSSDLLKVIFAVILAGVLCLSIGFWILSYLAEGGMSRFILLNDREFPVAYTILHDDGDNANNKTLTTPVVVGAFEESKFEEYGGTYCIYFLENDKPIGSFKLVNGMTEPQSQRSSLSVYALSKFSEPCEFPYNFLFDE